MGRQARKFTFLSLSFLYTLMPFFPSSLQYCTSFLLDFAASFCIHPPASCLLYCLFRPHHPISTHHSQLYLYQTDTTSPITDSCNVRRGIDGRKEDV